MRPDRSSWLVLMAMTFSAAVAIALALLATLDRSEQTFPTARTVVVVLDVPEDVDFARLLREQAVQDHIDFYRVQADPDRVGRRLDARDEVRRRERDLLDLGEVVLDVWERGRERRVSSRPREGYEDEGRGRGRTLVERKDADLAERELLVAPDLGEVEDVVAELLGLLGRHRLDAEVPRRVLALLDRLEQVLAGVVRVLAGDLDRLLLREELGALTRLVVELGVDERAVGLDELVRVARVAVHEAVAVGHAAVTEEDHDLVESLGLLREVVPEVVGVLEVRLRVALLRVDEPRELGRVPQEEDRRVVLRTKTARAAAKAKEGEREEREEGGRQKVSFGLETTPTAPSPRPPHSSRRERRRT